MYGKVKRSFQQFRRETKTQFFDPPSEEKIKLALQLAEIAAGYGIQLYSCCGDYLVNDVVKKAHCIDGRLLNALSETNPILYKEKPTREGCGCSESTDIGFYDSCPHGCIYCYANSNKKKASEFYKSYKQNISCKQSAFLGLNRKQSDIAMKEIVEKKKKIQSIFSEDENQLSLF